MHLLILRFASRTRHPIKRGRGEEMGLGGCLGGPARRAPPTSLKEPARLRHQPGACALIHKTPPSERTWTTQVRPPAAHRVCQVYASALPVAYAKATRSADWEAFARLVLRGPGRPRPSEPQGASASDALGRRDDDAKAFSRRT